MTGSRRTPTRDHDLRMHLGVILMALQMMDRPPASPLTADQKELFDIIQRAAKSMQVLLEGQSERSKSHPSSSRNV